MARRGWGRALLFASVAAAGMAAAQLGLGYGLDIIAWAPDDASAADSAWAAGLAWTVWVAATSVVGGAVIGDRTGGTIHSGRVQRAAAKLSTALAAAIGGLATIPLVMVPTQELRIVDTFAPHLLAGLYAAAGAVIGLVIAVFALASRAVAANVLTTASFLWVLAIVAVNAGGRGEVTHLGIWKFTTGGPVWQAYYIPGALIMLGGALMIGGLAAFPAAGRGEGRFGVAISGAMGPALVAAAYALAAPRPGHATFEQLSASHTAPYMVAAGLLGSILVGAVGAGPRRRTSSGSSGSSTRGPAPTASAGTATSGTAPTTTASTITASTTTPTTATGRAHVDTASHAAGRRSTPLGATSASAVTATASVPPASRVTPDQRPQPPR